MFWTVASVLAHAFGAILVTVIIVAVLFILFMEYVMKKDVRKKYKGRKD